MLREKMKEFVAKTDELGDRFWVMDGPIVTVGLAMPGGPTSWLNKCVGLMDEEEGGMVAYGSPEAMRNLCEQLNKLHAIEEMLS